MIFIVGFTFQFNPQIRPQTGGISVQEQIALSKRGGNKTSSTFDSRFVRGAKYRISRIRKDSESVKYYFTNLNNPACPDIVVTFPGTTAGDEYVAAISGQHNYLSTTREQIAKSFQEL